MSLPDFESGHKDPLFGGVFGPRTKDKCSMAEASRLAGGLEVNADRRGW